MANRLDYAMPERADWRPLWKDVARWFAIGIIGMAITFALLLLIVNSGV